MFSKDFKTIVEGTFSEYPSKYIIPRKTNTTTTPKAVRILTLLLITQPPHNLARK